MRSTQELRSTDRRLVVNAGAVLKLDSLFAIDAGAVLYWILALLLLLPVVAMLERNRLLLVAC